MKHLTIRNLLSFAALIFGLLTLFASSAVLFNYTTVFQKTGNYPAFILWMNLLTGPLYIMAAVGLKASKKWALHLLLVILSMLLINLGFFILLMKNDGDYEPDTLMALVFRIAFTGTLAFFAFNRTLKDIKS
mgnify:CR=1 FL=1